MRPSGRLRPDSVRRRVGGSRCCSRSSPRVPPEKWSEIRDAGNLGTIFANIPAIRVILKGHGPRKRQRRHDAPTAVRCILGSVESEYKKGPVAWATSGSRKGISQHQWAMEESTLRSLPKTGLRSRGTIGTVIDMNII
jgi:hypothetical protein